MAFVNRTRNAVLSTETREAKTLLTRMVGLLSSKGLGDGEGLWIEPCNSIHTWFMRFTIDAVFLDKQGNVVKVAPRMKPWRLTAIARKARGVLELPAGVIEKTGTEVGDVIERLSAGEMAAQRRA